MSTRRTLAVLALLATTAACQDPPLTPEPSEDLDPRFAPGGVPGPPPHVRNANACGLTAAGEAWCWGSNARGLLGTGVLGGSSNGPVQVQNSGALGLVGVSVGYFHACALTGAGQAWCWGLSSLFGNGAAGPVVPTPTLSAGGATLAAIEVGVQYACALDASSSASCWGTDNSSGQMGLGSLIQPVLSPAAVVGGLTFASLDSHNQNSFIGHTCPVTAAHEAWCWGSNQFGQLGGPRRRNVHACDDEFRLLVLARPRQRQYRFRLAATHPSAPGEQNGVYLLTVPTQRFSARVSMQAVQCVMGNGSGGVAATVSVVACRRANSV